MLTSNGGVMTSLQNALYCTIRWRNNALQIMLQQFFKHVYITWPLSVISITLHDFDSLRAALSNFKIWRNFETEEFKLNFIPLLCTLACDWVRMRNVRKTQIKTLPFKGIQITNNLINVNVAFVIDMRWYIYIHIYMYKSCACVLHIHIVMNHFPYCGLTSTIHSSDVIRRSNTICYRIQYSSYWCTT